MFKSVFALPNIFVPGPDSEAVQKLCTKLGAESPAVRVRVETATTDMERNCYVNVRDKVEREGGKMQLGWAVWQHGDVFIEGEPHAVFVPGQGRPWIDCTPHKLPHGSVCREILFIPNDDASYDFETLDTPDNVRLPLLNDSRVLKVLELFSRRTALLNTVPGFDVPIPEDVSEKIYNVDLQIVRLFSGICKTPAAGGLSTKVGRNDPCPCGSGKKYKKCHGRSGTAQHG